MIELGKAPLTEANIRLISLTFRVNEEWLRDGWGDMIDEEALLSDQEREFIEQYRKLGPIDQALITESVREKVELQELRAQAKITPKKDV